MRLLIRLLPVTEPAWLPLDNYPLAGLIYRSLGLAAPDYAEFLHEAGYAAGHDEEGRTEHKRFKFFVFSRVEQPGKRITNGRQWFAPRPLEWRVGSPLEEQMVLLAQGLVAQGKVHLGDQRGGCAFEVLELRELDPPPLARRMRCKLISPLFVAADELRADGTRNKRHLRADDPHYAAAIRQNLLRKYEAITGSAPADAELAFRFLGAPKSQLVQYRGTHHHCYVGEFEVEGNPELLRLGWECGFGEANSKGFGMVR